MASEQGSSRSHTGAADDDAEVRDEQLVVSRAALEDVITSVVRREIASQQASTTSITPAGGE